MTVYIAMLRGINVSGQKSILMADLKKVFESLKFTEVSTYIQSGNVVFRVSEEQGAKATKARDAKAGQAGTQGLAVQIEKAIAAKYAFEVPVVVRATWEMAAVLETNPYGKRKLSETEKLYISFLSEIPAKEGVKKLLAIESPVDEIKIQGREVYILCRGGYGKTVFSNTLVEKCLGVKSTTRNLATTLKLVEMAQGMA